MSKIALSGNAAGTATFTIAAPGTNTNRTINLPDTGGDIVTTESYPNVTRPLTLMTAQATTSGTSKDFTGIPSWAKRVTVMFSGVSTNGTSGILIQTGAGSLQTTGYSSASTFGDSAIGSSSYTTGFGIRAVFAAMAYYGKVELLNFSSNQWVSSGTLGSIAAGFATIGGSVSLSGALDRIRILTVNGTDVFDAGSVNVMYEG